MVFKQQTYLLVPGAWMGAWIWDSTISSLQSQGHTAYTLNLSGLDRTKSSDKVDDIALETHVTDVLTFIEAKQLDGITIVGHSYSGIVVGQVANRIPDKIKHIIYINAFLPQDGKALVDDFGEGQAEQERNEIMANGGWWLPPILDGIAIETDLSHEQQLWLNSQLVPHPGRTVTDTVQLSKPLLTQNATYIACRTTDESSDEIQTLCKEYGWQFYRLNAGHWPMVSVLDNLIKLL
ncbi:MAG: alpha/beta hydrolase family protein [Chloroflexota bacterium]